MKKIIALAKKWDSKKSLDGKMSYLKGNVKKQGDATKKRKQFEGNKLEYQNRDEERKAAKTSNSNRLV